MIKVQDLRKTYGDKPALRGISFTVNRGEIFGFLGPNGAGKTTTIKIITGQLLPEYGHASILDMDASTEGSRIRPLIGVVPERANLYERLTIGQNLEFFCRLYQCSFDRISYYLEMVDLKDERNTQVKKLSKGMRQKVLLIRALLHDPDVLFLDEPTSGLDPVSAEGIHRLLQDLNNQGKTIFLTSHNMEEVDRLCHRVAFLSGGQIAATGVPEELKLRYSSKKVKVLLKEQSKDQEQTLDIEGEESAKLLSDWVRAGKIRSIHSLEPTLADVFVNVTGREIS